ncbi:MAG: HNH endonuclease domain-containing protein [Bacteroidota bacterium]
MIQLKAVPPPPELTSEVVNKLTERFMQDGSSVWKEDYIKKALLEMSNYKCAYSEIRLQEEGKYMEVEHFLPKSIHKDKVVEWDNLLPASKFCNGKKGDRTNPIIHPVRDNPKEHLYMVDYVLYGKTKKGRDSVIVLGLNDPEHLIQPRFKIREAIKNELC